jgi:hypothetical protein
MSKRRPGEEGERSPPKIQQKEEHKPQKSSIALAADG